MGFNFKESLNKPEFMPMLSVDPPIKINLGARVFTNNESLSIWANKEDLKKDGVGGAKKPAIPIVRNSKLKVSSFFKNNFMNYNLKRKQIEKVC